jgi:DNA-directed RNA polymerase alpha subunit
MNFLLPKSLNKRNEVLRLAKEGVALAELEYLGVSTKVFTAIEDNCGAIYLEQLVNMKDDQILGMCSVGKAALKELKNAFEKIFEFDQKKEQWNKGSDRIEEYKQKLDKRKYLS